MMMQNEHTLRTLFWETTLRCNARCAFCGSGCGDTQHYPDELTTDEIKGALLDTAQKLDAHEIMLNVTGGEPLLRKDVFEVAGYAVGLGFSWGMVTNGSLITADVIDKMQQTHLKTLTVSLDGCRQTHEKLRRLPGTFESIMAALREICRRRFAEHLQVTTVVNRQNIDELEELRELLLPIGLDSWRVVTADPIGRAQDNRSILLNREEMQRYFAFCERYGGDRELPVIQSCSHFFGLWEPVLRSRCFECGAGKRVASILYNGDVFVCPNVERRPELIQGNVRTASLAELWQNGFAFYRQKNRTMNEKCRACYYREACLGDSLHTWDFERHEPRFCIRQYYTPSQNASISAMEALYNETVSEHRQNCYEPAGLRVFSDRPAGGRAVLTRQAADELFCFFDWGSCTERNRLEQMAALLGKQRGELFIVEKAVPVFLAFTSETTAVFTGRTLLSAYEALKEYRRLQPQAELLGFVHSHPNELETILSTADVSLHRQLLRQEGLSLSVLVNPQKRRCKGFCGEELLPVELLLLGNRQQAELWQIDNR